LSDRMMHKGLEKSTDKICHVKVTKIVTGNDEESIKGCNELIKPVHKTKK